jgi:hypothetical protein
MRHHRNAHGFEQVRTIRHGSFKIASLLEEIS